MFSFSKTRCIRLLILCCFTLLPLSGLWHIGQGIYIHSKAQLAQVLLESAWSKTVHGQKEVKPWPWADTWPVARLTVPGLELHRIVLAGANGTSLAFGPGHLFKSALPGEAGNSLIAGHRDTHFSFLKKLKTGDEIQIETGTAATVDYKVKDILIVDEDDVSFLETTNKQNLVLVTCYPFDALMPGGRLRYVVIAEATPELYRI